MSAARGVLAAAGVRRGLLMVATGAALSTVSATVARSTHHPVPAVVLAAALVLLFAGLVVLVVGAVDRLVVRSPVVPRPPTAAASPPRPRQER